MALAGTLSLTSAKFSLHTWDGYEIMGIFHKDLQRSNLINRPDHGEMLGSVGYLGLPCDKPH